jgi:hypothetical protein
MLLLWTGSDAGTVPGDGRPAMTPRRTDVQPFGYKKAKVPFYPPSEKWGTQAEPIGQMQLPLDPAESAKHLVTPADFAPQLFAAEPLIRRPICVNWDERGRLWVAETVDYPNELRPAGKGRDRLVICEDADGDGRADRVKVFAEKLSIPTGFTFARGGVVVVQAPDTLFLKDTDGDDVADEREVLFTGWATNDTHAGPSNLHYGFDNWIYGTVGYAGYKGTVGGEKHSFRQGFFRFRPDGSKLEFLRSTNNNTWGLGFSEDGILFGSTANGNPSVYMPIPNRYYERVRGWSSRVLGSIAASDKFAPITDQVRQMDYHGRFTAGAGHALYTARNYPRAYWNRAAFVAEPTGHLVATFLIAPKGADFASRNAWNLVASDDEWTSPTMAEVGPDGNVWVVDWYNYIIQHNPTPTGYKTGKGGAYVTDLRDKTHGRVYRLVAKAARPAPALSLKDATPDQLLAALKNDNLFWRRHAQRLLVERGKSDVVPALVKLVEDRGTDEIGLNAGALHALWTLHGLGALDTADGAAWAVAVKALEHPSAAVRRAACLVLPRGPEALAVLLKQGALTDRDAQVRLAALLTLAEMPADEAAGRALAEALRRDANIGDKWLPDAITSAAAAHDLAFLGAAVHAEQEPPVRALGVLAVVAEHHARRGPAGTLAALAAGLKGGHPKALEVVAAGLAKGWPRQTAGKLTPEAEKALTELMPELSPPAKGQLVRLAVTLGSKAFEKQMGPLVDELLATAADETRRDAVRVDAAMQAVAFRPEDAALAGGLIELVTPRSSPALAAGLLEAVGTSGAAVGPALVERLATFGPQTRAAALRVLLARPESTRALLDGVEAGNVRLGDLALDQKQALAAHPDRALAERARKLLERGGGLPSADRQKVVDQLLPLTRKSGDTALGKLAFQKHCATCHTHSGEGNKVGPDLTGMAAHTREHLLAEILDPSRNVEGNYRVYTVTTAEGQVFTGLLASETKTSIELIDAQAKRVPLQREDIDELAASGKSLMPEGFEKQLSPDELTNVLAFLTARGRYLPLDLTRSATVVSTRGMLNSEEASAERLVLPDWGPQTVHGVPFRFVDPQGDRVPNAILLRGPKGRIPPKMPGSVRVDYQGAARAIHLLGGVSGWGFPISKKGTVSLTVRLHYADGQTEDHPLVNGVHVADYSRRVDVPGSEFALEARGRQLRYLTVQPKRDAALTAVEFVKGDDATAPVIMAVTVEGREQ